MPTVKADISLSLDGYIDATGVSLEHGLGIGGEVLHEYGPSHEIDIAATQRAHDVGAMICGRRTYDLSIQFWEADGPTGPDQREPTFVLTHTEPDDVPENGVYRFVHGDLAEILAEASAAAGDRGISIMGGANTIQQFLSAGLVDELHLHVVPILFGAGTRLFELELPSHVPVTLEQADVSPRAVHLIYRIPN
jgi:dihydrofolate reductase